MKAKEKRCSFIGGAEKGSAAVTQFGFDIPTCCGYIKQVNDWSDDWVVSSHGDSLILISLVSW